MSWDARLQRVTVPQGEPKPVTLIYPYFANPRFLRAQLCWWHTFPAHLREQLRLIVVDDATPKDAGPAAEVLVGTILPFRTELYRITEKVRWNWIAARNIGAHQAEDGWLVLTDMDHRVAQPTAERLVYGRHDPAQVYAFARKEGCDNPVAGTKAGDTIHPHSASFFMTRAMFWRIGGYDERYSGVYGSDGRYRSRLKATAPVAVLEDTPLLRYEYHEDSSTSLFLRKQAEDAAALLRIDAEIEALKKAGPYTPRVLSLGYEQVAL